MGDKYLRKFGKILSILFIPTLVGIALFILIRDSSQLSLDSIRFNIPLILLSIIAVCIGLLVAIPVWRHILASFSVRTLLREDISIYCYSALGAILPGRIWTIAGRTVLYQKVGAKGLPVAAASIIETLLTGIAAMVVYLLLTITRPEIGLIKKPELGIIFSILVLILIHPKIFNSVSKWIIERTQKEISNQPIHYSFGTLAIWLFLEIIVICIGGVATFILLNSFLPSSIDLLLPIVTAWAAAVAVGNLFFWIPGTPLLRDSAMVIALTADLSLPVALVFVALVRVWTIVSLLILAGLAWFLFDRPYQKNQSVI